MKRAVSALTVLAALLLAGCGGSRARIVAVVRDDTGAPVANAPVVMFTFKRWIPGPEFGKDEFSRVEGRTDTNGLVVLKIRSVRGDLAVHVKQMPGFYYDQGLDLQMRRSAGGRWQPWGQTNVLVVRRIVNPIPMYVHRFLDGDLKIPANGTPVGFDLMKGDWLAPHGHGQVPDLVFTVTWNHTGTDLAGHLNYSVSMTLTFSNEGDGIVDVPIPVHDPPQGSKYRMPRHAPSAGFQSKFEWSQTRHNGDVSPWLSRDLNYFIRVRTQRDHDGGIKSALYGKIHGPVQVSVRPSKTTVELAYYLNPTPNDRNTEFAVGKNLMQPPPSISVGDP